MFLKRKGGSCNIVGRTETNRKFAEKWKIQTNMPSQTTDKLRNEELFINEHVI